MISFFVRNSIILLVGMDSFFHDGEYVSDISVCKACDDTHCDLCRKGFITGCISRSNPHICVKCASYPNEKLLGEKKKELKTLIQINNDRGLSRSEVCRFQSLSMEVFDLEKKVRDSPKKKLSKEGGASSNSSKEFDERENCEACNPSIWDTDTYRDIPECTCTKYRQKHKDKYQ
jgi:hypothetical protein